MAKSKPAKQESSLPQQVIQSATFRHVGPLPPPEYLERYARLIPDVPERLMAMAEKEQAFRHKYEMELLAALAGEDKDNSQARKRGEIITLFFFVICTSIGIFCLINDYPHWLAASLLGAPMLTAIAAVVFRLNTSHQKKSLPSIPEQNQRD